MASKCGEANPSEELDSSPVHPTEPSTNLDLETDAQKDDVVVVSDDSNKVPCDVDNNHDDFGEDEDGWETDSDYSDSEISNSSSFEFPFSSEDESDDDEESDDDFEVKESPLYQNERKDDSPWVRDAKYDFEANIPSFRRKPGIKVDLGDNPQPIDIFRLFITEDLVKSWVVATHLYVERVKSSERGKKILKNWKHITYDEMVAFMAVCHLMILSRRPTVDMYWETDGSMESNFSPEIMPHKRFRQILKFLQVGPATDNTRPFSMAPLVRHINAVSKQVYTPDKHIYVKEEKCPPKDFMPRRRLIDEDIPNPGYRFYQICEGSSGYVYNFEMHQNSRKTPGSGQDLVLRLMQSLLNQGYCVHIGNHFCTPRLCQLLLKNGTLTCGTALKSCKGLPEDLFGVAQRKGDMAFRRKGQLVASRWKGRMGTVTTLSTFHKPEMKFHQKENMPLSYISCVSHTFPREDFETLTTLYPEFRSALKKSEPFFYILSLVALQVTALIRKQRTAKGLKAQGVSNVICGIVDGLTSSITLKEDPQHKFYRLSQVYGGSRHHLKHYTQWDGEKNEAQCLVCARKAKRFGQTPKEIKTSIRMTEYYCEDCSVGLCRSPCFDDYHTKEDYVGC